MNIVIASDFDNTITLTNDKTAMTTFEEVLPSEYKEMRERIYKEEKLKQLDPTEILDYYDKIWKENSFYQKYYAKIISKTASAQPTRFTSENTTTILFSDQPHISK